MTIHRQSTWARRSAPYVTTALALEIVSLFGFAYFTDSHIPGISPLAATSIFIDGTKDILPTDDSQDPHRMKDALGGAYDLGHDYDGANGGNYYVEYSRDFGILTGGVGYDVSRAEATNKTIAAIKQAQNDNGLDDPIYVVGYSQGANASSDVITKVQADNAALGCTASTPCSANPADANYKPGYVDLSNVTFVMLGNGARNDGGLWARLPAGVYVPFLGLDFGASTNPTTGPDAPGQVLLISKQYDGASDWPKYVLINPLAAANAALGFMYVHNGYYQDVDISDIDTDGNGSLSAAEVSHAQTDPVLKDKYIITTNGNVTDVVIKNQPGDLPITQPLKLLGVPDDFILAIDPVLRAMIDAGYERPTDGVYPAEPVHFKIFPKPSKLFHDFLNIEQGADQTADNLEDLAEGNSIQPLADPGLGNSLLAAKVVDPGAASATPPAPPKPPVKPQLPTFTPQQWIPRVTQWQPPPPPPLPAKVLPPVEELPLAPSGGDELLIDADSVNNQSTAGHSTYKPGEGLKQIAGAVKQVYDATLGRLVPKPAASTAPSSAPEPPPPPPGPDEESDGGSVGGDPPSGEPSP